jgi:hypothetical protein
VPGVDDDGGKTRDGRFFGRRCGRYLRFCGALRDQFGERVDRDERVDVEHEAMPVLGDRREREGLRLHLGLQVEHDAHDAGPVARHAQALDVGVVGRDLAVELGQRRRHVGLEIEHKALGILHREDLVLDLALRFDREARVIARRPDAARNDLRFGSGG